MNHAHHVGDLRPRRRHHGADLRALQGTPEKDAQLEIFLLWPHKEIAGAPGEHDRVMRGVDALFAELRRGFAQAFPRVAQILWKIANQRLFSGRPAVVRFAFLDPLLAVIALVSFHAAIVGGPAGAWLRTNPATDDPIHQVLEA